MSFLTDAVEAIHTHWAELAELLDAPAREELLEILADAEADPVAAASDLRELVKPFTSPGHPVREALTPSGVRFQPGRPPPQDDTALLAELRALRLTVGDAAATATAVRTPSTAPQAPEPLPPYRPDADDAWLLAEPAVPAASLDLAPEQIHDLILLDTGDAEHVPAFQLDPASGVPYPVVMEINQLLAAGVDPWGAADWWLSSNVWLDAAPARLLGTGVDHALLSAARAEIPEW